MSLLDAQPAKPQSLLRKSLPIIVVVIVVLGGLLYVRFRNYSEELSVARFLTTLQEGKYEEGYRLWQPSSSYTYADFLRDWGEMGDYGKIREFEILSSKSKGSNTVIVTVQINKVNPPLQLLVDRKTKGLAYSIF